MGLRILGLLAEIKTVTDPQQKPVRQKRDPAAIMHIGPAPGLGREQGLEPDQPAIDQPATTKMKGVVGRRPLTPGQIDVAAALEIRRDGHIKQTALAGMEDDRHARDGGRDKAGLVDDPQASGLFCHKETAIRQESHAPRVFQAIGPGLQGLRPCSTGEHGRRHQACQDCAHGITPELSLRAPHYRLPQRL